MFYWYGLVGNMCTNGLYSLLEDKEKSFRVFEASRLV